MQALNIRYVVSSLFGGEFSVSDLLPLDELSPSQIDPPPEIVENCKKLGIKPPTEF